MKKCIILLFILIFFTANIVFSSGAGESIPKDEVISAYDEIIMDDFAYYSNNWPEIHTAEITAEVKNGKYYINNTLIKKKIFCENKSLSDSDFYIEISFTDISSDNSTLSDFGIFVGNKKDDNYYIFSITLEGTFNFHRENKGLWRTYIDNEEDKIINKYDSDYKVNTLKIHKEHDKLYFFINNSPNAIHDYVVNSTRFDSFGIYLGEEIKIALDDISIRASDSLPVKFDDRSTFQLLKEQHNKGEINTYVVIIAISQYKHSDYSDLVYTKNDANAFKQVLTSKWNISEKNIFELYDQEATKKAIEELICDELAINKEIGKNDQIIIYFSGHGDKIETERTTDFGLIVPYDGNPTEKYSSCISLGHISDFSKLLPAKQVLFILDSCFSGLAVKMNKNNNIDNIAKKYIDIDEYTREVISAGSANEEAISGDTWNGMSLFTFYLVEALNNITIVDYEKDNALTSDEIFSYISRNVTKTSDGAQNPRHSTIHDTQGRFVLFNWKEF